MTYKMLYNLINFIIISVLFLISSILSQPLINERDIKFVNGTTATIVGEDGLILKTTDLGQSWEELSSGITNSLFGYSPLDEQTALACGENGIILKTIDGGVTWNLKSTPTTSNLKDVEFVNSETALACGENGTVIYSTDGGESWETVTINTANTLHDIDFYDELTGYICGELGTLLKTEDGGRTFADISLGFSGANLFSVQAFGEGKIVVGGVDQAIFLTHNGGQSWFGPNNLMSENDVFDIKFFNENDGILAGENGMILRTTNGGFSWDNSIVNLLAPDLDLFTIAFADANYGISTGQNGIKVYTTNGGVSWTESMIVNPNARCNNEEKTAEKLLQNYPNPFNPSTVISYKVSNNNSEVMLRVYDITGREVCTLFNGVQNSGSYNIKFDASSLSSGVYFYKLIVKSADGSYSEVKKMILAK
jgi:photosystem II stability/assembly factor-like uncharacterized protein